MDWLLVSNIGLWIAFLVLAVICLAMARQIGVLYERVAPAGALMMNPSIKVGATAPEMALETIDGDTVQIGGRRDGRAQLLFFTSPDCPVCKSLMGVLKSSARAERSWLDVAVASDGDEYDHAAYVRKNNLGSLPYVVSEILGRSFGVAKLPYAVLIDEAGLIASMGIVNSREHLESLFEAKEHKVASIQEYLERSNTPSGEIPVQSVSGALTEESKT